MSGWDRVHIVMLPPDLDLTPRPRQWRPYCSCVEPLPPLWLCMVNDGLALVALMLGVLLLDVVLCGVMP